MRLLLSSLVLVVCVGCAGLFPTAQPAHRVEPVSEPGAEPEPANVGTQTSPALSSTPPTERPSTTQEDLARLSEFVGTFEFGECAGESLGGDPMCWDYGVRIEVAADGSVVGTIDGAGYQMTPYRIHATTLLAAAEKEALALKFVRYSDDTEEPPAQLAEGDLVGVLAKRFGRMCFAFSKLTSATGAKYLCKE